MTDKTITQLSSAAALTGAEEIPVYQSGNTVKTTATTLFGTPGLFGTQTKNTVLAGPTTGSAAAPSWRALVTADLPNGGAALGAKLFRTSTQQITDATFTAIAWTSGDGNPVLDENGYWATGNNTRLTAPHTGWYIVTSWHGWESNNNGQRYSRILLNGATVLCQDANRLTSVVGNDPNITMAVAWKFTAGDYVELMVYQSSGGFLNISNNGARFEIVALPW